MCAGLDGRIAFNKGYEWTLDCIKPWGNILIDYSMVVADDVKPRSGIFGVYDRLCTPYLEGSGFLAALARSGIVTVTSRLIRNRLRLGKGLNLLIAVSLGAGELIIPLMHYVKAMHLLHDCHRINTNFIDTYDSHNSEDDYGIGDCISNLKVVKSRYKPVAYRLGDIGNIQKLLQTNKVPGCTEEMILDRCFPVTQDQRDTDMFKLIKDCTFITQCLNPSPSARGKIGDFLNTMTYQCGILVNNINEHWSFTNYQQKTKLCVPLFELYSQHVELRKALKKWGCAGADYQRNRNTFETLQQSLTSKGLSNAEEPETLSSGSDSE